MKIYTSIVFFQGDEANEPLAILDDQGEAACIRYCSQWDFGDCPEETTTPPWGRSDDLYVASDYVLSYNQALGYVGLCAVSFFSEET